MKSLTARVGRPSDCARRRAWAGPLTVRAVRGQGLRGSGHEFSPTSPAEGRRDRLIYQLPTSLSNSSDSRPIPPLPRLTVLQAVAGPKGRPFRRPA